MSVRIGGPSGLNPDRTRGPRPDPDTANALILVCVRVCNFVDSLPSSALNRFSSAGRSLLQIRRDFRELLLGRPLMAGMSQFVAARCPDPTRPVSLADLAAAGVRLRPYEAVTIVRELLAAGGARRSRRRAVGARRSVFRAPACVSVEGPVAAGGRPVVRGGAAARLAAAGPDAGNQFRVPGGLKLVVARALGTLDLPPFASLEAFAEALDRFAATDPAAAIAEPRGFLERGRRARGRRRRRPAAAPGRRRAGRSRSCRDRARRSPRASAARAADRLRHPPRAARHRAAAGESPSAARFRWACCGSSSGATSSTGRAGTTDAPSSCATPAPRGSTKSWSSRR